MKLLKNVCFLGLTVSLLLVIADASFAQQSDSTKRSFFFNPKPKGFTLKPHSERKAGVSYLPESGVFEKPEETQYYQFPFKGQYYLDLAVEAYREELRKNAGPEWLSRFFRAISPFVNNRFQFGHYQIYDLPVVDRDNPLFQSYKSDQELE